MNEKFDLYKKLVEYEKSDFYPFHMPGHKRREPVWGDGGEFSSPYGIDITEINGFDNLHHAEGILKRSMEHAAKLYGADRTWYLVNGSTCGILAAICGTTTAGGRILMARNSHLSAYHGVVLNRLAPEYLNPEPMESFGIHGGIKPEDVRLALEKDRKEHGKRGDQIQAVFVVSPTYEGIVSDISSISKIVHSYGIPLIVDEAHGAHLPFGPESGEFPASALSCGADLVIQSLHKTLPCFTQTAILHEKGTLVDIGKLNFYLRVFQSSSPSYVFMAGIERCLQYMEGLGREEMGRYAKRLKRFYESAAGLKNLRVFGTNRWDYEKWPSVFGWDPSKIVIFTGNLEQTNGEELSGILRERYHLEMEMSTPGYVLAMTSVMDTEEGFERLSEALRGLDKRLSKNGREKGNQCQGNGFWTATEQKMALLPAEAMEKEGKTMALREAVGFISKEYVFLYPPGIPVLVPGEKITETVVEMIEKAREGGFSIQGISDPSLANIKVLRQAKYL